MSYKIIYDSNFVAPDGSSFNDPPFGFVEINQKEFVSGGYLSHNYSNIEYRQIRFNNEFFCGNLYWADNETGYAILTNKYNVRFFKFGCNHTPNQSSISDKNVFCTKCNKSMLKEWMNLVVVDSGWKIDNNTSIPNRGIRDYNRIIKFSTKLTEENKKEVVNYLENFACPGWTGVRAIEIDDFTLKFRTTWDSSD